MILAFILWALTIAVVIWYALSDAAKMLTVCGWCGKHLSGSIYNGPVSHGICPECRAKIEKQEGLQ